MKLFRVLSLLAALVATASAAQAQSISTGSLRAIREAVEPASFWQFLPDGSKQSIVPAQFETTQPMGQIKGDCPDCPAADETCWFMQLIKGCASSCERMRTQCMNAQANGESAQTAVGAPAHGLCPVSSQTAGCAVGVVRCCQESTPQTARLPGCGLLLGVGIGGCANQPACAGTMTCPVQNFLQVVGAKTLPAPAPCCCAKACACCESCKAKAAAGTWAPVPSMRRVIEVRPGTTVFSAPVAPPAPFVTASRTGLRPARLVTPDFEAHCERMSNRGDVIVLEGNVLLLCKKGIQPIRIEAQRVVVNMKDGTFSVEHGARPSLPTGFGVMRTSATLPMAITLPGGQTVAIPLYAPPAFFYGSQSGSGATAPVTVTPIEQSSGRAPRIIQVVPVPSRVTQPPVSGYVPR